MHLPRHEPSHVRNVVGKPVFTGGLMFIVSNSGSAQDGQRRLTLGRWPRVRSVRTDFSRRRAELLFDAVASTRTPTFQYAYEHECRRSSPMNAFIRCLKVAASTLVTTTYRVIMVAHGSLLYGRSAQGVYVYHMDAKTSTDATTFTNSRRLRMPLQQHLGYRTARCWSKYMRAVSATE